MALLDWCRDIDYGNLPQWLTLVLAIVIGGFSIWGVRTANSSYKISRDAFLLDVQNRESAQARLVYANLSPWSIQGPKTGSGYKIASWSSHETMMMIDDLAERPEVREVKDDPALVGTPYEGSMIWITGRGTKKYRILQFAIYNNSDQPISGVRVAFNHNDDAKGMASHPFLFGVMPPKSALHRTVISHDLTDVRSVQVMFRDSTGIWWKRDGSGPVEKDDPAGNSPFLGW